MPKIEEKKDLFTILKNTPQISRKKQTNYLKYDLISEEKQQKEEKKNFLNSFKCQR
jgi:hypothetical protein